jgi:hypothetical protein
MVVEIRLGGDPRLGDIVANAPNSIFEPAADENGNKLG